MKTFQKIRVESRRWKPESWRTGQSMKEFSVTGIHPTALIDGGARIGNNVQIGPFCVVEDDVVIEEGCTIAARAIIKSGTRLGPDNAIGEACIIGGRPQHLRAGEQVGELIIGRGNIVRENATIHRALHPGEATVIGDHNMIMINTHIAHDCVIGHHVIIANNAMLAGHVVVGDRAYLSGAIGIHQFCRVGQYAMVGGQAHITRDVPPYITVDGLSSLVVGLNSIGLRRNQFTPEDIHQLKAAYRVIYRSGRTWNEILQTLQTEYPTGPAAEFHRFLEPVKRGIVQERRIPRSATLRMTSKPVADSGDPDLRRVG